MTLQLNLDSVKMNQHAKCISVTGHLVKQLSSEHTDIETWHTWLRRRRHLLHNFWCTLCSKKVDHQTHGGNFVKS